MQVSGLLKARVRTSSPSAPDTPVERVAAALPQHGSARSSSRPTGRAIDGIVSERDIVRALADQGAPRSTSRCRRS